MISERSGAFPPNTLFKLKSVNEKGFFPEDQNGQRIKVKGIQKQLFVQRRLLTVTATYLLLPELGTDAFGFTKHCVSISTLVYGTRAAYILGNDEILGKPVLTMEQECTRDTHFHDWRGSKFTIKELWEYVNKAAVPQQGCTAGFRDEKNADMRPEDFLYAINHHIEERRRRREMEEKGRNELPDAYAYLSLDEVLAVRLYTGPASQLINGFLRQVALLEGQHKQQFATDPQITFAATVGHICRAIRKLSAIATEQETRQTLFRAVRGQLPKSFWLRDEQGLVCATELGFMSASTKKTTPLDYMSAGGKEKKSNLMWIIKAKKETQGAFHFGADISRLSQYTEEAEVVFPPCTMLTVQSPGGSRGDEDAVVSDEESNSDDDRAAANGRGDDKSPVLLTRSSTLPVKSMRHKFSREESSSAFLKDESSLSGVRQGYRGSRETSFDSKGDEKHFLAVTVVASFV